MNTSASAAAPIRLCVINNILHDEQEMIPNGFAGVSVQFVFDARPSRKGNRSGSNSVPPFSGSGCALSRSIR